MVIASTAVRARHLHRAEGVVRPGRGAHLPAALADHRSHRRCPVRQGPALEALLPPEAQGQGRPHEGSPAPGVAQRRTHGTHGSGGGHAAGGRRPRAGRLRPRGRRRRGRPRMPRRSRRGRRGDPSPERPIRGLADSKLVPPAERARLAALIRGGALAWAVAAVGPEDIDRMAIHHASLESMRRAVMQLARSPTWCWSTRSGFPPSPSRSAASSTATASARPSPRRRSWPRFTAIS